MDESIAAKGGRWVIREVVKPRRIYEEPEERWVEESSGTPLTAEEFAAYTERTCSGVLPEIFSATATYFRCGDFFEVLWENVDHYAEEVGDITLLKCFTSNQVVGVQFGKVKERMGLIEVEKRG